MDAVGPTLPGDGVDLSGGDLHGEWVGAVEIHPEGLRLIHGEHDAAVLLPQLGETGGEVIDVPKGERAQAGGERIIVPVIGNPESALEV